MTDLDISEYLKNKPIDYIIDYWIHKNTVVVSDELTMWCKNNLSAIPVIFNNTSTTDAYAYKIDVQLRFATDADMVAFKLRWL